MEPHKLKKWKTDSSQGDIAYFYTCARPGRSGGPKGRVSDQVVSTWVEGLPGPDTAIVSLLGRKQQSSKGSSEFSYYSFSGSVDTSPERGSKPTFAEWLDTHDDGASKSGRARPPQPHDYRPRFRTKWLAVIEAQVRHLTINMCRTVFRGVISRWGVSDSHRVAFHRPLPSGGLSSERLITNRLGFNKNSLNPA